MGYRQRMLTEQNNAIAAKTTKKKKGGKKKDVAPVEIVATDTGTQESPEVSPATGTPEGHGEEEE